jgi:uncharacterized protein (TIGR02246 family)
MTNYLIEADSAVRQLYARYADAVWRKDLASVGQCYAEDAEWRIEGRVCRGRAEIAEHLEEVLVQFRRVLITLLPPVLEAGEGWAHARTASVEQMVFADGKPYYAMGTYHDRIVRQGGVWRFAWRLFVTNYAGPSDLTGSFFDNPDYGPMPAMPPLDAATSDLTGTHPQ